MRILVVEDDKVVREALVSLLIEEEYVVDAVSNGDDGLFAAQQGIHDMLVLDVMLPGISGLEIIKRLRASGSTTPILLLTAVDSVDDRVAGLEAGADDYLVKPYAMRELLARIKAVLRRKGNLVTRGRLSYGGILLNSKERDGFIADEPLGLSTKEYEVLEFLMLNKEQVVTREQLFDRIWGFDSDTTASSVDVYIHYLRKKLAPRGLDKLIHTVRGTGFMLKERL
ncbi:MAG: two component transcriptional regulator, winged helix family [Firmicutes bacterium]|nr:two component transcriptional regulator, winged helix family [Bacillota bacterium]